MDVKRAFLETVTAMAAALAVVGVCRWIEPPVEPAGVVFDRELVEIATMEEGGAVTTRVYDVRDVLEPKMQWLLLDRPTRFGPGGDWVGGFGGSGDADSWNIYGNAHPSILEPLWWVERNIHGSTGRFDSSWNGNVRRHGGYWIITGIDKDHAIVAAMLKFLRQVAQGETAEVLR
ncbi:MAG: hypothetical protein AAF743_05890 [Planctomycetota bacterium]